MLQIKYARASLANPKSINRRQINLDFILEGSSSLNKLTFKLTGRHREYHSNLDPQEFIDWPKHNEIIQLANEVKEHNICWIGKGLQRAKYQPGFVASPVRLLNTGAILIDYTDYYKLHVGVEDWTLDITLTPSDIDKYPFIGEYHSSTSPMMPKAIRGVWK